MHFKVLSPYLLLDWDKVIVPSLAMHDIFQVWEKGKILKNEPNASQDRMSS